MSIRFLPTASLLLVLLSGCRTNPHTQVYLDNVNAEKRLLEDTLYDLQYDYECNLKELENLRAELTRVRRGDVSASPAPRDGAASRRKPSPPSAAGGDIAPDELAPPVVEPGTPAPPQSEPPQPPRESQPPREPQPPQEPDDLDMSPPKLELGPPQEAASVSLSDPAELVSRWTPRAQTRPRPDRTRIAVADQSGDATPAADAPHPGGAGGSLSDATHAPAPSAEPSAARQARRPQWRPYR
ncbi:MAG: hypothetical protein MUF48_14065 [Pirellulaceae bacterium]|nr:hypothetical protein [Pirellulaceae bacterium]